MRIPLLVAAAAVTLAGCSSEASTTEATAPTVAVSHYPVQYLVEKVGGDLVTIEELTSPGTEPHDLELSPQQVGEVQNADAVFYLGGFQAAVDEAVPEASGKVVDLTQGLPTREQEGATDPHVWLDPVLMQTMAGTVAETLAGADPTNAEKYRGNATALQEQLGTLDAEWRSGTRQCATRTMVVGHEAFGYLAAQYGFTQKGISGLSPEGEPSAAAIAELARFVRGNDVTTVYTETAVDPAVSQTIADEAGAATAALDTLETAPASGDYLSAMRDNLTTVSQGQSCS